MPGRPNSREEGQKGQPEKDKIDIQFSPISNLTQMSLNYLGGHRYFVKMTSELLDRIKSTQAIWVGINPLTLAPVFMEKDTYPPDASSRPELITGPKAGVRLFDLCSGKSVGTLNPTIETLREGKIPHYKGFLLSATPGEQEGHNGGNEHLSNPETLAYHALSGSPLWMAENTGYSAAADPESQAPAKKIHPDHLPILQYDPKFALPIFPISEESISSRATEILEEWMVSHPGDLLYMAVAVQKTLQWIWIAQHENHHRDALEESKQKIPVPFASLNDWLSLAHFYEAFHQIHQLTFYCHPFRFLDALTRNAPWAGERVVMPDILMEELILELIPLAAHPMGLTLPCFFRGSTMPDLAALKPEWGYLDRTKAHLSVANQPDWRSLYWSQTPLWVNVMVERPRPRVERPLAIPFNWIPTKIAEKLELKEPKKQMTVPPNPDLAAESNKHTVLDPHFCEGLVRLSPLLGPNQFVGRRPTYPSVVPLVSELKRSFAAGTPIWAILAPSVPENIHIESITLIGARLPSISAADAMPNAQNLAAMVEGETTSLDGDPGQPRPTDDDSPVPPFQSRPLHSAAPPMVDGSLIPLPAEIIQLPAAAMLSTIMSRWLWHYNKACIQWGIDHGFKLEDMTCSNETGLITFPGLDETRLITFPVLDETGLITFPDLDETTLVPEEARMPKVGDPTPQELLLWNDLLGVVDLVPCMPQFWKPLLAAATSWVSGSVPADKSELLKLAAAALEEYLITFLPLHIAYCLLPPAPSDAGWLMGKLGKGKVSVDVVGHCLTTTFEGSDLDGLAIEISTLKSMMPHFPAEARVKLAEMFGQTSPRELPWIFRHLFAGDHEFLKELGDKLVAKYGVYEEIDFQTLLLPLPDDLDFDRGDRPSKRMRADTEGLIAFA